MKTFPPEVYLIIGLVIGALAYMSSEQFRRRRGITPWKWPSAVWALIGFLSLLVCVVLMFIAKRQTLKKLASGAYGQGPGSSGAPGYGMPGGFGSLPQATPPPSPPGPPPGVEASPPPAWHPDPGGRHRFRYWDGTRWTEYVSDDGGTSVDPPPY